MAKTPSQQLDTAQQNLLRLMRANDSDANEIAKACNCTPELVYRWMNGTRRITDAKVKKLAAHFGVTEAYIKYGTADVDTDKLGEVAGGVMQALIDHGIVHTTAAPDQIGNLIALLFADYETDGDLSEERIRQYIKLIHPQAVTPSGSRTTN